MKIVIILLWMLVGLLVIMGCVTIHVIDALKRGYSIETVSELSNLTSASMEGWSKTHIFIAFMWGLLIWPIRLIEFTMQLEDIYEMYDWIEDN